MANHSTPCVQATGLALGLALLPAVAMADSAAVTVFGRHQTATVFVESIGTLFNGTKDTESGSGVMIGNQVAVTNSHVILNEKNYKSVDVLIRFGSRKALPLKASRFYRDDDLDLAVVELPPDLAPDAIDCPIIVMNESDLIPIGSEIFAMGFPVERDLSIVDGIVSNKSGDKGRWQTNGLINHGNSGGPIFSGSGMLIGFAVSGIVKWNGADVDGVNFFIPATSLIQSNLFSIMKGIPQKQQCWGEPVQVAVAAPSGVGTSNSARVPDANGAVGGINDDAIVPDDAMTIQERVEAADRAAAEATNQQFWTNTVSRSFTVSVTKDDHPVILDSHSKNYEKSFDAEPGFKITGCTFTPYSANNADDLACNIMPGGAAASFTFRLTSGPSYSRWRGWWGGTVTLDEVRAE